MKGLRARVSTLIVALCIVFCATCSSESRTLRVTGDVEREQVLQDYQGWLVDRIHYDDQVQEAIPLRAILNEVGITGNDVTIFFSSSDGAVARVPLDQILDDGWLRLSSEYGWQFISEKHPRQAKIKFMDYLVVAASEPKSKAPCVRIIDENNEITLTYGDLFMADGISRLVLEGEAKKGSYNTTAYSRRTLIPIANYLQDRQSGELRVALAYYADGSQGVISLNGFLEWRGNSADYLGPDGRSRKKNIIGIWVNPPELCITQMVPEALVALEHGSVLIILLDGLSYYDLKALAPPFLSAQSVKQARTVMPSITPVALGSILTGMLPKENGITNRGMRDLKVDDVFAHATKMGKSSVMVEGSTKVINTSVPQLLNPDLDSDGTTDEEVFATAQKQLATGVDLLFVHFHGYDDIAHSHGPLSPEASAKLMELDGYVESLCVGFSGTVLVIADHGQHATSEDKLGDHGEFRALDMTVPWIRWEQP
ncbi:MAG: hypothetical protein GX971_03575 [Firmicutes bacterium]|nr:hypothetical protein [Bacillota bacterium]